VPIRPANDASDEDTWDDSNSSPPGTSPDVPLPQLFVALDCAQPAAGCARHSLFGVERVVVGRAAVRSFDRTKSGAKAVTLGIPDRHMSIVHARIERTPDGAFVVEDAGSRNGTFVNAVAVDGPTLLADGDLIGVGHTLLRFRAAVPCPVKTAPDVDSSRSDHGALVATVDPSLARRAEALARVARSDNPVLLLGETGVGKEVLARAIHAASNRRGPLVAVNCGALPPALVEGQLFGHVRGAFTGAITGNSGFLRSADGGTLLLDEIGDLPLPAQAALLRALQEREVVPVGAARPTRVDIRVIGATMRPLESLVKGGAFRKDLYARMAGFTFHLPPLRERPDDIGVLVAAFAAERPISLTRSAGRALLEYEWPDNVRELHRTLSVAVALAEGAAVGVEHLPEAVAQAARRPLGSKAAMAPVALRTLLVDSLTRHQGNVSKVARELGKAPTQIRRWMARFQLVAATFRAD